MRLFFLNDGDAGGRTAIRVRPENLNFVAGHRLRGAQPRADHESRNVLSLLLAAAVVLVRFDHAHAIAHEVRVPDAPV
jgi:hypothetical protein